MKFTIFTSLLLLAAQVKAAAVATPDTNITVLFRWTKTGGVLGISAFDCNNTLIAANCTNTLKTGIWKANPITVDLDAKTRGKGNITVGGTKYPLTSKPKKGPVCWMGYWDKVFEMKCFITMPSTFKSTAMAKIPATCHKDTHDPYSMNHGYLAMLVNSGPPEPVPPKKTARDAISPTLVKKQSCVTGIVTNRVGDGNPHQNYYAKQVTESNTCGSGTCNAAITNGESTTVDFSASINFDEWISGGFDVSKTWTTEATYECDGVDGESVCVWYNSAYTAYTCQDTTSVCCQGGSSCTTSTAAPGVIYSPNSNGVGSNYYCVRGTCRSQGDGYWNYNGPAGGPGST